MNDSLSILLATTFLALGGLGLYMYKSSDYVQENDCDEDVSIENETLAHKNQHDQEVADISDSELDQKPRKRNVKTQRIKKNTGSSRRRY